MFPYTFVLHLIYILRRCMTYTVLLVGRKNSPKETNPYSMFNSALVYRSYGDHQSMKKHKDILFPQRKGEGAMLDKLPRNKLWPILTFTLSRTLALLPSMVTSSNSSPSLNFRLTFLNVDVIFSTQSSSTFLISSVDVVLLPTWRKANPIPEIWKLNPWEHVLLKKNFTKKNNGKYTYSCYLVVA